MFKAIAMIKKRQDISWDQFVSHYENNHVPLALSCLDNLRRYVRHYIKPYGNEVYAKDDRSSYDVITEIWFDDEDEFLAAMNRLAEPEIARLIAEDEERIFDRSSIRFMTMTDMESVLQTV